MKSASAITEPYYCMRVLRAILIALLLFPQVLRAQFSFDPGEGCLNVHERFINEQFSVGAGAGYSYHQQYQFSALPVYFSTHYFFADSRFSPFVNIKAGIYWMLGPKNIDTFQKYSISGKQPGFSLYVSPGAGVKVHLTSHIGLMASVSYDGYLVNAFDSAKNNFNFHTSMVPNLGINFGMCFQIPGW